MSRVQDIMSENVASCPMDETLNRCAEIMWDHDCGCVPLVDQQSRVVGIITDRDVCMGAYTQGRPLQEISASSACSGPVQTCKRSDTLAHAEDLMTLHRVRRLPVVDDDGRLIGVITLSDLARHLKFVAQGSNRDWLGPRNLALVLEAVSRPRGQAEDGERERTQAPRAQPSP